ncbi:MAG: amidohydrolase family protein [Chloroflexota bacterium]
MSNPINALFNSKYILEGRLITMGPAGVIRDGAIYIDGGEIKAVQPTDQPAPDAFRDAPRVRTGDSIYPGLIELHNHLSYNAMPLWDVPRHFTNNGQWKNHEDYQHLITKPTQVLGRSEGIVEALIRFVECRCLLGGVTTSQGITLSSSPGITSFYRGIVRNVEETEDPRLPEANTRIANPDTGGAESYLESLQDKTCYLQHLSEGIDETARGWFQRLQLEDGDWAINDALCGIHSTALHLEDFREMAHRGASVVWSPLSNYLLYGDTIRLYDAKESGVLMALGCDWAPSGSKNLLGELKVAWLASRRHAELFSPEELVAMVTRNAAQILKWDQALGTIEPGKRADFVCVNGKQGDDYLRLIEARETTITLVLVDGVPRLGQPWLMEQFGPGTEEITVGRSARVLNLQEESSHPLVRDLTLAEATARLQDAMARLPELAQILDASDASGLFSGSDAAGSRWQIVLDFEQEPEEADLARAGLPLAPFVSPMTLDPITVADDATFLPRLVAARNVPEFIKKELPALYGEEIPLPDSAGFLRRPPQEETQEVPPQLTNTTQELKTFLRTWGQLGPADLQTIVSQALLLLEQNYVHLPLKRAMHAVDPLQRLRLLQRYLQDADPAEMPPEIEIHNELAGIFISLRDLHTTYRLPAPFAAKTAWLPFLIEAYWEGGHRKYMVSKVVNDAGPDSFVSGVEALYWNGLPMEKAVACNAERHRGGGNEAARHARALNALTIRPLAQGLPPEEEWVTLRYRDLEGQIQEYSQPWLVFEPGRSSHSITPATITPAATALGLDVRTDDIQEAKKVLYAGSVLVREERALARGERAAVTNTGDGLSTFLPTLFRARPVSTPHGEFGYLRIFSFNVDDDAIFVDEFVRLLRELPQDGLILDVRGNGGGLIFAAERILQTLTPRPIEPQRAQFINSTFNLDLCRKHAPSTRFQGLDLGPWERSIAQSVSTGSAYSAGFPITPPAACNDLGQQYYGPVVLIVDALCYSATDIFAAGFQDHGIGLILGVDDNTGAGGANVWSHTLLRELLWDTEDYAPLPHGADLRVAVRRTLRVGPNAGDIVEDLGVRPDHVHKMQRRDLLEGNVDLIARAAELLATRKSYTLDAAFTGGDGPLPQLTITTRNLTRLDVLLDDRPRQSLDVQDGAVTLDLADLLGPDAALPTTIELRGYDEDTLAATHRTRL